MKLTTLLMILAIMQVSAVTRAQKVSLSVRNMSISNVFQQIRTQTGYDFAYTTKTLENTKPVTISVKDKELKDVLNQIFSGQPIDYTIDEKLITVSIKEPSFVDKVKAAIAASDVTGRVTDEHDQPLPGASVKTKDNTARTTTDAKGSFTLKNVQSGATIVITFIGYEKKEVAAIPDLGQIKLSVTTNPLDEIKIIAYGQQTDRFSVGNVSSVSAAEIERQPINNPLLALEGKVTGLFVQQTSGISGAIVKANVQGINSIANGTSPLFVIDGVPYLGSSLPTSSLGSGLFGTNIANGMGNDLGSVSPLNFIDPNIIESISVLKDADATAIYGARAANGAILITTKKGKAGDTRVDLNMQQGWGKVTRSMDLMNTQQYLQMRHEGLKNDGYDPYPSFVKDPNDYNYDINGFWDTTRTTNWQKVLLGNTSHYQNYSVNISGGNTQTQYLIGSTYNRETSVFPGDFANQKTGLHFSINNKSSNGKFQAQLTGSYLLDNNLLPASDLTNKAIILPPDAPQLYNADGSLNFAPTPSGSTTFYNPLNYALQPYSNKANNLFGSGLLAYEIMSGLNAKVNLGYTKLQVNEFSAIPLVSLNPEARRSNNARSAQFSYSNNDSWSIEPQLTYDHTIGKGRLSALVGATAQQSNSNGLVLYASGFTSDNVLSNINSAPNIGVSNTANNIYKNNSLFGRLNYNWDAKYLIDVNWRRDGSSRFGSENQFHNFGAIAAGWIFSEERFIKTSLPFLSYGKIKVSYGTTGNDQIGDYQYLNLYYITSGGQIPYHGVVTQTTGGLPNPYLQWEETKKLMLGLDLGLLKDRIVINASYSQNRSSNQLLGYNLPNITGSSFILENFPATVQNTSIELNLNTTNIKNKAWDWRTSFNFTIPRNKLIAFPDLSASSYANQLIIGQPIYVNKVFRSLGVDPATGVYVFADHNGERTFSPTFVTDQINLIDTHPKFYGGFQSTLRYKNFELDMAFNYVKQIGVSQNAFNAGSASTPGQGFVNQPTAVLNRWQRPGDLTTTQQYSSGNLYYPSFFFYSKSNAWYTDASYLRLRNASFSYTFAKNILDKLHLNSLNVYLNGQNLLTFTKYKGLDPENQTGLPPLQIWTMGVRVGL